MLSKTRMLSAVRIALLAAAVVMIAIGFARGEAGVMLKKAVNICLECIGLG